MASRDGPFMANGEARPFDAAYPHNAFWPLTAEAVKGQRLRGRYAAVTGSGSIRRGRR
jgi:hypothetical protein